MELAAYDRLVGQIYDCVIDPGAWPAVLDAVRTALHCANGQLVINDLPTGFPVLAASVGIEDAWLARQVDYADDFRALWAPHLPKLALDPDKPLLSSRWISEEALANNRYVTEWATPQGLTDSIGVVAVFEPTRIASFGFGRTAQAAATADADLELAQRLIPHLRRAVVISNLIDAVSLRASTLEAALDRVAIGAFLVDDSCRLVHANAAGGKLLQDRAHLLHEDQGRLVITDRQKRNQLSHAVAAASQAGGAMIGVPDVDHGGLVVHVLPLGLAERRAVRAPSATAILFVTTTDNGLQLAHEAVAALYDLTPAEARVLVAAGRGLSRAEIGTLFSVSESTVKSHLERIFSKTGLRRRAELTALVARLGLVAAP